MILTLLIFLFANAGPGPCADGDPVTALLTRSPAGDPHLIEGSFRIDRGPQTSLWVPPGESLEFRVHVDLGLLGDAAVGTVTMSSGLEPFVKGLPLPGQTLPEGGPMVGWLRVAARGGHLGYDLDHTITTRFLPQEWPSLINLEVQTGSENRKREVKIGRKDGEWVSTYRGDTHCRGCTRREHYIEPSLPWNSDYHCSKCKRGEHRHWGTGTDRMVPEQAIDILGAVYLARGLVREGKQRLKLTMIQKRSLWDVTLQRGELKEIRVGAGTFLCREVRLLVSQPKGEEKSGGKFTGLFGIRGALKIWLHETTGVPVQIEGDVPLGNLMDLHATVQLATYRGVPEAFKAIP